MPGNTDMICSRVASLSTNNGTGMGQPVTAAAADYTGAGLNNVLVWTADTVNGGFIQRIRLKAVSTNVASVMRFFINNGAANTIATNNTFFDEVQLPATTASAIAPTVPVDLILNFALEPGFRIYMGLGTAVAGGWVAQPVAGKY